ncbi:MAG: VWA domain-containing protein [Candidatus Polarisedimenticolaceae bacterium]|nr:VWA domain-containing protein [Candidatus Polarisedimenticolaceae bacterium]
MDNFHFLRPLWFLALLPLLAIIWLLWHQTINSKAWRAVCDPELLPYLLADEQGVRQRWPLLAIGLAGLLGIIAMAGPVWEQREQPLFREQSALVLALDLSRSMDATDIKPSRLARARYKISDILKQRREGQTALIVYAATPFLITPLTDDTATIAAQLNSLETALMPSQGTRPDLAVKKAAELLQQAGQSQGDILLITDGIAPLSVEKILSAMDNRAYRISLLGVGTPEGAPILLPEGGFLKNAAGEIVLPRLDGSTLSELAQAGGGRYHKLSINDDDIQYLLAPLQDRQSHTAEKEAALTTDQWQEEGPWLLLLILPLAVLAFRRGYLLLVLFMLLPHSQDAMAVEWQELWTRADQQAFQTLQQGDASAAARQFENREWKAAAHYRAGEYEQAIEVLDGINSPDALYNKGNALAQFGKLPEALQAYDQALELNPEDEDIAYNRELVEKQLEQQQKEDQQQQNSDEDQQQQNSDEDQQSSEQQQQSQSQQDQSESQSGEQQQEPQQSEPQQGDEGEQQEPPTAQEQPEKGDEQEQSESEMTKPEEMTEEEKSMAQATEQWLRRIPDDPGGLLRRKFLYQYQRQPQPVQEAQQW